MSVSGNRLFRWRSYTPLLLTGFLFAAMVRFEYPFGNHGLDQMWDFFCFGIALIGLLLRVLTVGFVPRDTSGRNTAKQVAASLNTTGMYSVLRHPLYFANHWMWLGVALFPRVWWLPALISLVYVLVYERIVCAEEDFLVKTFGDQYTQWAMRTPVFWPRWGQWRRPSLPFSWKAVLRRENSTLLGVVTVFFLLECTATFIAEGQFEFDVPWVILFLAALTLYAILKILKKKKLLNEPQR
jgi:protein-S-isoprenylcysteine O-methyltransferase Ste14